MKTVAAVRHVAFEDLGIFEPVLTAHGFACRYFDAGVDNLQDAATADLVVILGGPVGAYEDDRYLFLKDELSLIEKRLRAGSPLLGICLGAQLMARSLGARVYPGPAKEIGWSSLRLTAAGTQSCLSALGDPTSPVLHWHGDTFDLPAGAECLAATDLTPNQAFQVGARALALQFHLEADPAKIERWLIGHTVELSAAGIDVSLLRRDTAAHGPRLAPLAAATLSRWLKAGV